MQIFVMIIILISIIKSFFFKEEDLKINVSSLGAELMSIKYKGKEYLHDEDNFWKKKSPILFPIVGRLKYNGSTIINNKNYSIPMHGFANDMNFTEIGDNSYLLTSNDETLKHFPFEFELYVSYIIENNILIFNYTVVNTSPNETMLFGIGGHPGFKCDYFKEKSSIEFEDEETDIKVIPVVLPAGLMSNETKNGDDYLINKTILEIKRNSFDNDAIVFTDIKSNSVILRDNGTKILKFNFGEFKYLGIWSAKGDAPFICLEPWYNTPDYINSTREFKDKKDIIKLEPNATFRVNFSVEFFDENAENETNTDTNTDSDTDTDNDSKHTYSNLLFLYLLLMLF